MNAVWQQREEARRYLRAEPHNRKLRKTVKMAGKNLRKVREAAVLSFFWDFVRKLETRARKGDQAWRPRASKGDEPGREARPKLGVHHRRERRTPEGC